MDNLRYGQIVVVTGMVDPNGVNPKDRPAVVVTPSDELADGAPLIVAAISTLKPGPVPDDHVPLPWHPQGHPRTGLKTNCAVVCRWLQVVEPPQVARIIGFVPGQRLEEVAATLSRLASGGSA